MLSKIKRWARKIKGHKKIDTSYLIPRDQHIISRDVISSAALKVLYRLKDAGYQAFLVGGGVRDILLGRQPKDFDVTTDAHPEEVREIFRNSRIIGRRFRLVHVFFDQEIVEVSTFRANAIETARESTRVHAETGMIQRDNTFGTIEEDAWRRDFTVNALYYNIVDFSVVDYTRGMQDLHHKLIRIIGDPVQRFHEDPVRLLRAIRFAAKLNFNLETQTELSLKKLSHLLQHVPASRLYDECLKLFFEGNAFRAYQKLVHYHYLDALFPNVIKTLQHQHKNTDEKFIHIALQATDARIADNNSVNPAFLFAAILWPVLQTSLSHVHQKKFYFRLHQTITDIMRKQIDTMMIPRRLQFMMQMIWIMQFQLEKRRRSRIINIFQHRYFRAAFDFMGLRVQAGELKSDIYEWWKQFQSADELQQQTMIESLP